MPAKPRIGHAGVIYHVTNCGDRRERFFHNESERKRLLAKIGYAAARTRGLMRSNVRRNVRLAWRKS